MKTHHLYISTDANRKFLQLGISNDMILLQQHMQDATKSGLFSTSVLNRIVYLESFSTAVEAEKRYQELCGMGRMVRERLIRKNNPDWLSLSLPLPGLNPHKKAAVFA